MKILISLMALCFVVACSSKKEIDAKYGIQPKAEVRASSYLAAPLDAVVVPASVEKEMKELGIRLQSNNILLLANDSLEKEYLLRGHIIRQNVAPTGSAIKSRVVAFRKINKKVYLMEASQGHVVTDDLVANLILTEFDVLSEHNGFIAVDWNQGMRKAFTTRDWYFADEGQYSGDLEFARANASYIKAAQLHENTLRISQIMQLDSGNVANAYEFRYLLEPYNPNPDFVPHAQKSHELFKRFGYFRVHPILEMGTGRTITRSSKWNEKENMTFHISANTPKYLQESVRIAIQYWNRAFGKEFIKVAMAPKGVTAPTFGYNIVQWVPWDNAGFAYADASMDPRSGEIMQANVYMTSAFIANTKSRAAAILRDLDTDEKAEAHAKAGIHLCDYPLKENYLEALREVMAMPTVSDELVQKLAQDYVAEVIVHEVGHTLGLRHNFAGTLMASESPMERNKHFERYLRSVGEDYDPYLVVSSSSMDYTRYADATLFGNLVQKEANFIADYDRLAMEDLYLRKDLDWKELPPFCTDQHVGKYIDCQRFDEGAKPIEYLSYALKNNLMRPALSLLEAFVRAKYAEAERDRVAIEHISLNSVTNADRYMAEYIKLIELMRPSARLLSVEHKFPTVDAVRLNERVREAKQDSMANEFAALAEKGISLEMLIAAVFVGENEASVAEKLLAEFDRRLAMMPYSVAFTDSEQLHMRGMAKAYFAQFEAILLNKVMLALLGGTTSLFAPDDLALLENGEWLESFENALAIAAKNVLVRKTGSSLIGEFSGEAAQVPEFYYSTTLRKHSTLLLKRARAPWAQDWLFDATQEIKEELQSELNAIKESIDADFFEEKQPMSRNLRRWARTQKSLLEAI